jgi:hypothetical protein
MMKIHHKKIKIKIIFCCLVIPCLTKWQLGDHSLVCKKLTYPLHRLYPKTNHKTLTFHLPLLPHHGAAFGVLCMVKPLAVGCSIPFVLMHTNHSNDCDLGLG